MECWTYVRFHHVTDRIFDPSKQKQNITSFRFVKTEQERPRPFGQHPCVDRSLRNHYTEPRFVYTS
jgi:hypothetical protein